MYSWVGCCARVVAFTTSAFPRAFRNLLMPGMYQTPKIISQNRITAEKIMMYSIAVSNLQFASASVKNGFKTFLTSWGFSDVAISCWLNVLSFLSLLLMHSIVPFEYSLYRTLCRIAYIVSLWVSARTSWVCDNVKARIKAKNLKPKTSRLCTYFMF